MKNKILLFLIVIIAFAGGYYIFSKGAKVKGETTEKLPSPTEELSVINKPTESEANVTQTQIDKNKSYTAVLKTSEGNITIDLNAASTPITVSNFISLARKNFYNGTIFHRVMKGFMIQGGDPKGDGTGGPGYKFNDEPFEGEYTRGTIAMANAGPNTNGSQFFIMHADYPLQKNYVIFGMVSSGIEVVDKIANSPVEANVTGELSKPITPVKVESIEIIEK